MRKTVRASLIVVLTCLFVSVVFVQADFTEKGSIRGTVYQDLDGNGVCGGSDTQISNFAVVFSTPDGLNSIQLRTGSDGTYGLVGVDFGEWIVTAVPPSSSWRITSANPIKVNVTENDLVKTDIDFCVQGGGSAVVEQAVQATSSLSVIGPLNSSHGLGVPPSFDLETNYEISQTLLETELPVPDYEELEELVEEGKVDVLLAEQPNWLAYVNQFRAIANLSPVTENPDFSQGAINHARFMVVNDQCCAHSENPANPLFSANGHVAAVNGNIFSSTWTGSEMEHAMNFWISAPFHLLGILDPALSEVGYGEFTQDVGVFHYSAVLDVRSNEIDSVPVSDDIFPVYFPADGSETFVVRRSLPEWPDPLATPSCANFTAPTGPPLILMVGEGDQTPVVTSYQVYENGREIEACVFTELTYQNPDPYAQQTGRVILDTRDAIVITPRLPLNGGATYRVELTVNNEEYGWEFTTRQK